MFELQLAFQAKATAASALIQAGLDLTAIARGWKSSDEVAKLYKNTVAVR